MGQTSGCFYSPKCSIFFFTCCHLNCYGESTVCMGDMKKVVISEAMQQFKI